MARGRSGRIVLEIDPALKRELYLALERQQKTLKDWFLEEARRYLVNISQRTLFEVDEVTRTDLPLDDVERTQ